MPEFVFAIKPMFAMAALVVAIEAIAIFVQCMFSEFNPVKIGVSVGAVVTAVEVFLLTVPIHWFI
jgi:hypothetical protein